jgi:2-phospho-L-lactate guanylyltransferase
MKLAPKSTGSEARPFLVVPVKPSVGSKQRLAAQLPPDARRLVSRALASRMVRCVVEAWPDSTAVVVGDDPEISELCARMGLATLPDAGAGQSEAVRVGQAWCLQRGAGTLATVAADLPAAEPSDLARVLELARALPPRCLTLIPDRAGSGTNGLILNPADCDPFSFGPDSSRRHGEAAQRLGLEFRVVSLPNLAWDVDRLEDLVASGTAVGQAAHPVLAWAKGVADWERQPHEEPNGDGG